MSGVLDRFDLRTKNVAGPPKPFVVRVGHAETKEEGEHPAMMSAVETEVSVEKNRVKAVEIIDKRDVSKINRLLVLERLHMMVSLPVPKEKEREKEGENEVPVIKPKTAKVTKRIVIGKTIDEPIDENELPVEKIPRTIKEKEEAPKERAPKEGEDITKEEVQKEKAPKRRYTKRRAADVIDENINLDLVIFENEPLANKIPKKKDKMIVRAPSYYMNNRRLFVKKLYDLFKPRRTEMDKTKDDEVSCEKRSSEDFALLTHQEVVRDYLNTYSPYRGLLIFHGLGSGKTCTSIAIAEGMKSDKQILIMTPASLKTNYFSELKKCGDDLYRKNQYWEYISAEKARDYVVPLAAAMSLDADYIQRKGVWLVNVKKPSNFEELTSVQKSEIDAQLDIMISKKYSYINYKGGLDKAKLEALTNGFTTNPFDDKVVVIDEAHNLVSRIVNKLKDHDSVSYRLYDYLMSASNSKIVFLSGTPIINYPNEIGILFNMLRGYIKTWNFPIISKSDKKINTNAIMKMFEDEGFKTYDYINYSGNNLVITRNPFGFVNVLKRGYKGGEGEADHKGGANHKAKANHKHKAKADHKGEADPKANIVNDSLKEDKDPLDIGAQHTYDKGFTDPYEGGAKALDEEEEDISDKYGGVVLNTEGNISDDQFKARVLEILRKNNLEVVASNITITNNKALPDDADSFLSMFVNPDTGVLQNTDLFKRRVLGLTSYFKSAQENLLPKYNKNTDRVIERIPMSEHQFNLYAKARKEERDREKKQKKQARVVDKNLFKAASSYRVMSRAICNFSFPDDVPRPMKIHKGFGEKEEDEEEEEKEIDENEFDAVSVDEDTGVETADPDAKYANEIKTVLRKLKENSAEYFSKDGLQIYSPKMLQILENLEDEENVGLHLVYSQFRALEGIGIFKEVLEQNGFAEFRLTKNADREWDIQDFKPGDEDKPKFVLYTGTESIEEKEIIRHIYNSNWENLSISLRNKLSDIHENNFMGEIIKVFMITSSGAEGINLENTRFVHIMEPYWNPVRVDQVIGRARRICSHKNLPKELQTVRVHIYLSNFTPEQMKSEKNIDIRVNDVSRLDRKTPVSTDEYLFELANTKETITRQILTATKESAMDCSLYNKKDSDEPLVCYNFGSKVVSNDFASIPDLALDATQRTAQNLNKEVLKGRKVTIEGREYLLKRGTDELYDMETNDFAGYLMLDKKNKLASIRTAKVMPESP